jgi:flagellar hook-length control protein FliK
MAMNPEGLGTVFVNFEVQNGAVKLSIKSNNDDTLKKLEQQIGVLKENISKQGLKLENIELSKEQTSDSNERSGAENHSRNSKESRSERESVLKHSGLAGGMDESQNLQDEASPVFKTDSLIEEYI